MHQINIASTSGICREFQWHFSDVIVHTISNMLLYPANTKHLYNVIQMYRVFWVVACNDYQTNDPENTRPSHRDVFMLGQRRRRWSNIGKNVNFPCLPGKMYFCHKKKIR